MSTVLIRGKPARAEGPPADSDSDEKKGQVSASSASINSDIPPLGEPVERRTSWFKRGKPYDPDAVATLPSVFDDPATAEKYQPRADW